MGGPLTTELLLHGRWPGLYVRLDRHGQILAVSEAVTRVTGHRAGQVVGANVNDFIVYNSKFTRSIRQLIRQRWVDTFELQVVSQSGAILDLQATVSLYLHPEGGVIIEATARDVTGITRLSRELGAARKLAEQSLRVKQSFLANMSHEVRTPLNGILGMVELLSQTQLDETQLDYVQTLRESGHTLMRIVNDILDLSKIDEGKFKIKLQDFNLERTLHGVVRLYRKKAADHQVIVVFYLDKIPHRIKGDETRIVQVISNLLSNAIKFTRDGSITIQAGFNRTSKRQGTLRVSVTDTGEGIPRSKMSKLFEPFSQLDTTTTKAHEGTGLGLVISKKLVELMGGRIGVESAPGRGSTFWFEIPVREVVTSGPTQDAEWDPASVRLPEDLMRQRLLLVDDNATNRKVLESMLLSLGIRPDVAPDGPTCLRMAAEHAYQIIYLDVQMPDMDGIQTLGHLRAAQGPSSEAHVVAVTAYSMREDRQRLLGAGFDEYLSKPVSLKGIYDHLIRYHTGGAITVVEDQPTEHPEEAPILDSRVLNGLIQMTDLDTVGQICREFIDEYREAFQTPLQRDQAHTFTHTLKGAAGMLGACRLSQAARRYELQTNEGVTLNLPQMMEHLSQELERFISNLRQELHRLGGQLPGDIAQV